MNTSSMMEVEKLILPSHGSGIKRQPGFLLSGVVT